jgi:indolepyruvate ferredoxin oxidoreductase
VPLSLPAIERAIALNGVAVELNLDAFRWGRRTAHDPAAVAALQERPAASSPRLDTLEDIVAHRAAFLEAYQNRSYARGYLEFVQAVADAERARTKGRTELARAVATYLFKLMAYKDEYEVARLYAETDFLGIVGKRFKGGRLTFHLAPPIIARRDPSTGEPRKRRFGPWMMTVFRLLARLRFLRGTPFDIFGHSQERRRERRLIEDYRATVESLLPTLAPANHALAVEIGSVPEHIRGYGHVKDRHLAAALARQAELIARYRGGEPAPAAIAAE